MRCRAESWASSLTPPFNFASHLLLTSQCPNLRPSTVRQRIASVCRASFSLSDAANVSKVGASQLYGGTFAQLMNSKTKISRRDVLTVGIKTYFLASKLSRCITGNFQLSSEWSWTKRVKAKNKSRISKRGDIGALSTPSSRRPAEPRTCGSASDSLGPTPIDT